MIYTVHIKKIIKKINKYLSCNIEKFHEILKITACILVNNYD